MRVRTEHWQIILDIGERNPELITNKFNGIDGKAKGHVLWQNVSYKLNSLGFGEKSVEEWRRAVVDWKSKTKKIAAKLQKDQLKTGGGPPTFPPLTDLEKRLVEIMGAKAVDGDELPELGFGKVTPILLASDHEFGQKEGITEKPSTSRGAVQHQISAKRKFYEENNFEERTNQEMIIDHSTSAKRKFSDTRKPSRRVRPKETERLSQKLIDLNQKSVDILKDIANNTESIANSLKGIERIMQQYLSKTR